MVPHHLDQSLSKFREVLTGFVDHVPILNSFVKSLLINTRFKIEKGWVFFE